MKKTMTSWSIMLLLMCMASYVKAQDLSVAVEYLGYINNQYVAIMNEQWEYTKAISKGKGDKSVEKRRQDLLASIKLAKENVFKMPRFKDDASFKNFVVNHLNIHYLIVNEDYGKLVNMEEVAEQSYDLMEAYLLAKEKANDKLSVAAAQMQDKVREFAEQNSINLVDSDSKIAEKMKVANLVFGHYNRVYLVFFKSYMQESYFLNAMATSDVAKAEQSAEALITETKAGLDSLGKVPAYNGDASMLTGAKAALKFYQEEASKHFPVMTDYLLKKQNFAKIKAGFDKIKESARTQADVDKYNKAVNDLNAAVEKYNKSNDLLNKQREAMLKEWNTLSDNFLKKHVN